MDKTYILRSADKEDAEENYCNKTTLFFVYGNLFVHLLINKLELSLNVKLVSNWEEGCPNNKTFFLKIYHSKKYELSIKDVFWYL